MYKSSLKHIHDPVLSSLKMKDIRLLFFMGYPISAFRVVQEETPHTTEGL
jgi:hypothetical protein